MAMRRDRYDVMYRTVHVVVTAPPSMAVSDAICDGSGFGFDHWMETMDFLVLEAPGKFARWNMRSRL